MAMTVSFKLWSSWAIIACALGTVTMLSIHAGPSSSAAMLALRVAHQELFWAKIVFRDPAVQEAEAYFAEARTALQEGQYEQSIFAAYQSIQRVRDIKGGLPSLYARREGVKNADQARAIHDLEIGRTYLTR